MAVTNTTPIKDQERPPRVIIKKTVRFSDVEMHQENALNLNSERFLIQEDKKNPSICWGFLIKNGNLVKSD